MSRSSSSIRLESSPAGARQLRHCRGAAALRALLQQQGVFPIVIQHVRQQVPDLLVVRPWHSSRRLLSSRTDAPARRASRQTFHLSIPCAHSFPVTALYPLSCCGYTTSAPCVPLAEEAVCPDKNARVSSSLTRGTSVRFPEGGPSRRTAGGTADPPAPAGPDPLAAVLQQQSGHPIGIEIQGNLPVPGPEGGRSPPLPQAVRQVCTGGVHHDPLYGLPPLGVQQPLNQGLDSTAKSTKTPRASWGVAAFRLSRTSRWTPC